MAGIKILNWNVGGAKYLESRDTMYLSQMNQDLRDMITNFRPDVVTLQEVVWYGGSEESANCVVHKDVPGYHFLPTKLISTEDHAGATGRGKWIKLHRAGWPAGTYFAQGNAMFVRRNVPCYPAFSLPSLHDASNGEGASQDGYMEVVQLECGLYFGDRNTEPRAAQVVYLVYSKLDGTPLAMPLDVFFVNLHLTTLMKEREGVPAIDEEAAQVRMRQLDIVTNAIISRYNTWRKTNYYVREVGETCDQKERHAPVWILAGDFNFTPESIECETLIRRGFINMMSQEVKHGQPRHRHTKAKGAGQPPTITVDYVFGFPVFEALDPGYVDDNIQNNVVLSHNEYSQSDHYPLRVSVPIKL